MPRSHWSLGLVAMGICLAIPALSGAQPGTTPPINPKINPKIDPKHHPKGKLIPLPIVPNQPGVTTSPIVPPVNPNGTLFPSTPTTPVTPTIRVQPANLPPTLIPGQPAPTIVIGGGSASPWGALTPAITGTGIYPGFNSANLWGGGNPYSANPWGSNPYNPWGASNPYNPYASNPYNPWSGNPYNPYTASSYSPWGTNPYSPYASNPYGYNNPFANNPLASLASMFIGNPYMSNPLMSNPYMTNPLMANPFMATNMYTQSNPYSMMNASPLAYQLSMRNMQIASMMTPSPYGQYGSMNMMPYGNMNMMNMMPYGNMNMMPLPPMGSLFGGPGMLGGGSATGSGPGNNFFAPVMPAAAPDAGAAAP